MRSRRRRLGAFLWFIVLLLFVSGHVAIADTLDRESAFRQVLRNLAPIDIDRYKQHVSDDDSTIIRTFYRDHTDEEPEILERAILDVGPLQTLLGQSIEFIARCAGPPQSVIVLVFDEHQSLSFEYGGISVWFAFDEPVVHQITVSDRTRVDFSYEGLVHIGTTVEEVVHMFPETAEIIHGQMPDYPSRANRIYLDIPDTSGRGRAFYPDRDLMLHFNGNTVDSISILGSADRLRRATR